jgi:hypothetical protein
LTHNYYFIIDALVAEGVFLPSGTFPLLPPLLEAALREALRHKVLHFLFSEYAISWAFE